MFYLIATLNATFAPDYDFTDAKSSEFSRERSLQWVIRDVDNNLSTVLTESSTDGESLMSRRTSDCNQDVIKSSYSQLRHKLWEEIDKEIVMSQCDIYRYIVKF